MPALEFQGIVVYMREICVSGGWCDAEIIARDLAASLIVKSRGAFEEATTPDGPLDEKEMESR